MATSEHKSTLGPEFISWFRTTHGDALIKQEHIPVVFVKLKVNAVYEVDTATSSFTADFTVMQDWYDPSVAALPIDHFKIKDHFDPAITIENFMISDEQCLPGGDQARLDDKLKGRVKRTARYRAQLYTEFNCRDYPFDYQDLTFEFKSAAVESYPSCEPHLKVHLSDNSWRAVECGLATAPVRTREELIKEYKRSPRPDYYHSSVFDADKLPEWELDAIFAWPDLASHDKVQDSNEVQDPLLHRIKERYLVKLRVMREPMSSLLNVLLPVSITGFLSFITFFLDVRAISDRATLITTLLLTMIAFKYVISERLPRVAYLTAVDSYIRYIFLILLEQGALSSIMSVIDKHYSRALAASLDTYGCGLISAQFVWIHIWIGEHALRAKIHMDQLSRSTCRVSEHAGVYLHKDVPHTSTRLEESRYRVYSAVLENDLDCLVKAAKAEANARQAYIQQLLFQLGQPPHPVDMSAFESIKRVARVGTRVWIVLGAIRVVYVALWMWDETCNA